MIDIENIVFDTVYNGLHELFPEANITSGYDEKKATYPAVIVRQTNNVPVRKEGKPHFRSQGIRSG